eukprot:4576005-Prymnesium_polylepis.2
MSLCLISLVSTSSTCEGCEWSVFEALSRAHPSTLARIDQLAIELHAYASATPSLNGERHATASSGRRLGSAHIDG